MRKIVDKALYDAEVNEANKRLIKDFLTEKKAQGRSKTTLEQYENDLRIIAFLIYKHFGNVAFYELTRKNIRNLSIMFQDMGMSNARVNRLLSALRSLLEFCADDDDYDYEYNVGSRVKGLPRNPVREITFLTDEQIEWLIDTLVKDKKYLMAVYLALSYYSAARKSEVHQVLKDGLTDRYFTNVVIGKGGKKFRLYYNDRVRELIRIYLEDRGEDDIPQLFVRTHQDKTKSVVTKQTFNYWCEYFSKLLSRKEGKTIRINPHCFRHSRLENLSKQGIPIHKLKTLANHNDISTTEKYLADRTEDDIADIFQMDAELFKI